MKILQIIGRLGMGGDTVAVVNTINVLCGEGRLRRGDVDFLTHDIGYQLKKAQELRGLGHKVIVLPGDVRSLGPAGYYKKVKAAMEKNGPYDVVHVHTSMQSGVALMAAKRCGIPVRICHAHTNAIQRQTSVLRRLLLPPLFRMLIRSSATQLAACGQMAGRFLYGTREPFYILKNGIDLSAYEAVSEGEARETRRALGIPEDAFVIGHIGRYSHMKNHPYLLKLSERLREEKKLFFVFVGDGEEYEETARQIRERKLPCIQVGRRTDIPVLLHIFDLLLLPSLAGEGFPITLVEAQAAGCPCLVSEAVTREADLGLGLVEFLPLEKPERWEERIRARRRCRLDRLTAVQAVCRAGFEQNEAAEKWMRLYETAT